MGLYTDTSNFESRRYSRFKPCRRDVQSFDKESLLHYMVSFNPDVKIGAGDKQLKVNPVTD